MQLLSLLVLPVVGLVFVLVVSSISTCFLLTSEAQVDLHELCERGDAECVWILLSQAAL